MVGAWKVGKEIPRRGHPDLWVWTVYYERERESRSTELVTGAATGSNEAITFHAFHQEHNYGFANGSASARGP